MINAAQVERFAALFQGSTRARGKYIVGMTTDAKNKRKGKATTLTDGGATLEHFTAHLQGKVGLGVIPIRDDASCMFGAIDIDVYDDLDLPTLEKKARAMGLRLVVCRSKSGGAHLYLYLSEAATAAEVRALLAKWAAALGYPKTEIFPKQSALTEKDDVGNWINVPFFDAERTTRYAIGSDGKALALDEFLTVAEGARTTIEAAEKIELPVLQQAEKSHAPESTASQRVRAGDVPEGQRHNDLKTWLVAKRKQGLDGEELAYLVERKAPELWAEAQREGMKEAADLLKWVEGKISPEPDAGREFGQLTRIVLDRFSVVWKLEVRGKVVQLETQQLDTYRSLRRAVMEQLGEVLPNLTPIRWNAILTELMLAKITEVEEDDLTTAGLAWTQTLGFLTNHGVARDKDELLLGRAWTDDEKGRTYFVSADLVRSLRQRHNFIEPKAVCMLLRDRGGRATTMKLKGKTVRVWWLPKELVDEARQTEDFAPVKVTGGDF